MSVVCHLIAFGLRQTIGEGVANVVEVIASRFRDQSRTLPAALGRAHDRAWRALGVALAGDGFLDRVKVLFASGDDKGIRAQVHLFLEGQGVSFRGTPAEFRQACLDDLQRLRRSGSLSVSYLSSPEVAQQAAHFQRYTDPESLIEGARRAVDQVAEAIRENHPNLAKLLRTPTPSGPPLLASAFCYFFRREVETNGELAHGLFFENLQQLSASQTLAFDQIDQALATLGERFDAVFEQLARLESVAVGTHEAVLDIKAELQRLSRLLHDFRPLPVQEQQKAPELPEPVQEPSEPSGDSPLTIKGPKRAYTLLGLFAVGDVADVHLARAPSDPASPGESYYILKVSRIPEGHRILDRERNAFTRLLTSAGDTTYRKYLPTLAESFPARDTFPKRVNVFLHEPGFYTLEQVHEQYPALDGRHLAWIFKRLLTVLGFSHRQGIVHGAVLPCHVLIHAGNHGLQLVGWGQSVDTARAITTITTRFKDWYPPEVLKKQPASGATDVFLAARCVVYLAGGDPVRDRMPDTLPLPLQRFLRSCLLEGARMRPDDAWKLLDEFDELLGQLYGPPKFHELIMT
jgi:hypothetical protein